ncbi:MAG TPA: hypothetical protein VLG28_10500 [Acidimicrobiia bacterium]|jgi:hypothetical protein|nr:hypothetical protein [Acidimicrobiia bacterium]
MLTHDPQFAASIVNRWNHVLDLELAARRGDERALRARETIGLRRWFL